MGSATVAVGVAPPSAGASSDPACARLTSYRTSVARVKHDLGRWRRTRRRVASASAAVPRAIRGCYRSDCIQLLVKRARSRHCAAEHVRCRHQRHVCLLCYCTYLHVCVACNKQCCRLLHHPTPLIGEFGVEHVLMNCGRWYSLVGPPSQACAPTPSPDVARSSRCPASRCCSRTGGEVGGVGTRVSCWKTS